jgi:hypothetical protein
MPVLLLRYIRFCSRIRVACAALPLKTLDNACKDLKPNDLLSAAPQLGAFLLLRGSPRLIESF